MTELSLEELAARLTEVETLWNTAIIGTPAATRYEGLRNDLVDYLSARYDDEALRNWFASQGNGHAKELLDEASSCWEWRNFDKNYADRRMEEVNSYALTRKPSYLPSFQSEADQDAWIADFIDRAWNAAPGYRVISNPEKHREAFEWLRAKHSFPDLEELIGPPLPEHHLADRTLTLQRKKDLLLLGLFSWRGFILTYRRWHYASNAHWSGWHRGKSWQWVAATACAYPRIEVDLATAMVRPPRAYVWEKLTKVATAWHIDREPKKATGIRRLPRWVICDYCGFWFLSPQTQRISYQGRPRRFCNEHALLVRQTKALVPKRKFKR